jgi:hypothetical protein
VYLLPLLRLVKESSKYLLPIGGCSGERKMATGTLFMTLAKPSIDASRFPVRNYDGSLRSIRP